MDAKSNEFLKTKAGKAWFYKQTMGLNRKQRNELKNRLVDPPGNVKKWLSWNDRIKKALEKDNDFNCK